MIDVLGLLAEACAAAAALGLVAATPGASVAAWLRPGGLDQPSPPRSDDTVAARGIAAAFAD